MASLLSYDIFVDFSLNDLTTPLTTAVLQGSLNLVLSHHFFQGNVRFPYRAEDVTSQRAEYKEEKDMLACLFFELDEVCDWQTAGA